MKRIIFTIIIFFYSLLSFAQFFESKTKLQIGYSAGSFIGKPLYNSGGTIAPAYYPNIEIISSYTVGVSYKLSNHYSVGISTEFNNYTEWKSAKYNAYDNSFIKSLHICPIIQYHTAFSEHGLWNRLKLYTNLSPVFSHSKVVLPSAMLQYTSFWYITEISYGARLTVGAEYSLSNFVGVFVNTSLQQSFVKSQLYIDSRYLLYNVNIGLSFTLFKSKTFNL